MNQNREKTMIFEEAGLQQQVTFVRPTATKIDEKGLRRALTARVYDKYTKKTLDRRALENAMENGAVDPKVVLQFCSPEERSVYLKYSEKKVEEDA